MVGGRRLSMKNGRRITTKKRRWITKKKKERRMVKETSKLGSRLFPLLLIQ